MFVCWHGILLLEIIQLSLMNSPSMFSRMIRSMLAHLWFVRLYIDDVVILSKTYQNT